MGEFDVTQKAYVRSEEEPKEKKIDRKFRKRVEKEVINYYANMGLTKKDAKKYVKGLAFHNVFSVYSAFHQSRPAARASACAEAYAAATAIIGGVSIREGLSPLAILLSDKKVVKNTSKEADKTMPPLEPIKGLQIEHQADE